MNFKHILTSVLLLTQNFPGFAEDAEKPVSQSAKNILNLKIDKRLGLLHKTWEVPALLTFGKRDSKFPNLFGHQNARFLQPGPPPYFQQPEGANEAGIATLAPKPVAVAAPKIITSVTAPAPSAGGGPPPIPGGLP